MTWRDNLMLWKWRFEQFQSILGPVFYITTLTLLIYPYIAWRLEVVYYGIVLTWLGILLVVLMAARVWDAFGLWREGQRTTVRRNQFAQHALTPKEVRIMQCIWIPLLKKNGLDSDALKHWIEESAEE